MARPLRIEFAGALYHVTARGNERRDIFFTDDDRSQFLDTLEEVREIQLALHAFCQMTNHYHLLIETAEANLCRGMQQLNGVYATGQSTPPPRGHLLQVRYTGIFGAEGDLSIGAGSLHCAESGACAYGAGGRGLGVEQLSRHRGTPHRAAVPHHRLAAVSVRWSARCGEEGLRVLWWPQASGSRARGCSSRIKSISGLNNSSRRCKVELTPSNRCKRFRQNETSVARELAYYANRFASRDRGIAEAYHSGAYSMGAIAAHFGVSR